MTTVTLGGNPIELAGRFPQVGETAPAFTLTGANLADVGLDAFAGQRKVLNIVPSLDTPTCATSTRRFNAEAWGARPRYSRHPERASTFRCTYHSSNFLTGSTPHSITATASAFHAQRRIAHGGWPCAGESCFHCEPGSRFQFEPHGCPAGCSLD